LLKTRGGWRETPQAHEVAIERRPVSELTDEELERMIGTLQVAIDEEDAKRRPVKVIEHR
jgi:hypothetical protein